MSENKYKLALEKFPKLLDTTDNVEVAIETLFRELRTVLDYESGLLLYLNTDRLNIRYRTNNDETDNFANLRNYINLSKCVKKELFENAFLNFDVSYSLAQELGLNTKEKNVYYIISPLTIRSTIFGFILLARKERKFEEVDENILKSYSSVCAYAIKDNELFDVFRIQFKVLQDDIEEKAQAYKTIKEQNKKILESDKAKNEFIANISHELRTPLNAILGFTEVLKEKFFGELNPKQSEYVGDIHISAIHLLGMINEILDISKIESNAMTLNKTDIDFDILTKEVVNIITPLAEKKKIKITINTDKNVHYSGDYQKLQQILFNLLSNAIKFTPKAGSIEIGLKDNKHKLTLWVKDSGIGIDKKYYGKIFAKFVQLENTSTKKESSTGLGLTITRELVKLHDGDIKIESKINEGTKFIIELPRR